MKKLVLAALVVATVAGCNVSSGTKGSGTSNQVFQHAEDVSITSCKADPTTGFLDAKVTITNHSSKPSDYSVTIAFEGTDGSQLDTGYVIVNNLEPNQSTVQDATGFKNATPGYTCKVSDAMRTAA